MQLATRVNELNHCWARLKKKMKLSCACLRTFSFQLSPVLTNCKSLSIGLKEKETRCLDARPSANEDVPYLHPIGPLRFHNHCSDVDVKNNNRGSATAQVLNRQISIAVARVRSKVNSCRMCGWLSDSGRFSPNTLVFLPNYQSTNWSIFINHPVFPYY